MTFIIMLGMMYNVYEGTLRGDQAALLEQKINHGDETDVSLSRSLGLYLSICGQPG